MTTARISSRGRKNSILQFRKRYWYSDGVIRQRDISTHSRKRSTREKHISHLVTAPERLKFRGTEHCRTVNRDENIVRIERPFPEPKLPDLMLLHEVNDHRAFGYTFLDDLDLGDVGWR